MKKGLSLTSKVIEVQNISYRIFGKDYMEDADCPVDDCLAPTETKWRKSYGV